MTEQSLEFEILVVGAGPAGVAAACTAAAHGKKVCLIDDTPWLGGQIWRGPATQGAAPAARRWLGLLRSSGVRLLKGTSVIAAPATGVLLAESQDHPLQIAWQKLILATGARELFLPFPGWTLPGVLGPGGLQALVKNGWPIEGKRVVIAGSGPLLLAVADGLKQHGAQIVSIAEQAPRSRVFGFGLRLTRFPEKLSQAVALKMRLRSTPYRCGVWPVRADGTDAVRSVTLTDGENSWTETCHYLACGFGLVPNLELPLALGCAVVDSSVRVDSFQATSQLGIFAAGELTGISGADGALVEGQIAGHAAAGHPERATALFASRERWHRFRNDLARTFALRPELKRLAAPDTLLCRCEDVPLGRVRAFGGWREAKLQTRCGMGPCQGRVCGAAARFILGWDPDSVRPPVLPARLLSLISPSQPGPSISQS